jgi:hypothetical protein
MLIKSEESSKCIKLRSIELKKYLRECHCYFTTVRQERRMRFIQSVIVLIKCVENSKCIKLSIELKTILDNDL